MATLQVNGTASVSFSTEIEVDVDEQVSEYLSESLPSDIDLDDVDIIDVEFHG
jgi:hypothetical protein